MTTSLFALHDRTTYQDTGYDPRTRRIISVDGEGQEENGRHAYTLLAASDDKGFRAHITHDGNRRPATERRAANHGLRTKRCLEFLLSLNRTKYDLVVAFAFTYDATKILHDVPVDMLTILTRTEVIEWCGYKIEWRPRKYFVVTDLSSGYINERGELKYGRKVKVWDTFSYFQMAFVKALDKSASLFNQETRDYITAMKARRDDLSTESPEAILKYCYLECESLSILIRDLLTQLDRLGFHLTDYSGPGHLATLYYKKIDLKRYMPYEDPYHVQGMPKTIAERSYYGGWFETSVSGEIGDCWSADLNSAYPAIAAGLPCLAHGQFERVREYKPGYMGFYKVGSRTKGPWAPFPFRMGKEHYGNGQTNVAAGPGSVIHAHGGVRWVGSAEVDVAINHYGAEAIPVYDGWIWKGTCNHRPFESLRELFDYRKDLKVKKDGAEKAIKLIINAVYGKLAQSIGWTVRKTTHGVLSPAGAYKPPPFQCFVWAAWITSGTRATILEAVLKGGEDVVSIATDGIISKKPIAGYENSSALGEWEVSEIKNVFIGIPGIYAYDTPGKDGEMELSYKTRGFQQKHFPAQYLRDEWSTGVWEIDNLPIELCEKYGQHPAPMTAFVPVKQGVTRKDPRVVIGEWVKTKKAHNFRNTKREMRYRSGIDPLIGHDGGIIEYDPYVLPDDMVSAPYKPKQSWEDLAGVVDYETLYVDVDGVEWK